MESHEEHQIGHYKQLSESGSSKCSSKHKQSSGIKFFRLFPLHYYPVVSSVHKAYLSGHYKQLSVEESS